jgi:hypothetical protein
MVDFNKKTREEKLSSKISAIHSVGAVERVKRSKFDIEVVNQNIIEGGVEVFVKAWHPDGIQVGFGKDGSVEIERFRIFNPPTLVPDPNGDIVRKTEFELDDGKGGTIIKTLETRFRNDPKEALLQTISHSLGVKKELHKNNKIITGKIGNTVDTYYPTSGANSPCDGYSQTLADSWDGAHNSTSATAQRVTAADEVLRIRKDTAGYFYVTRMVFNFDTSNIDTDSIISATASFASNYGFNWGQESDVDPKSYIGLVNCVGLAGTDNLVSADFDNIGDSIDNPTLGSDYTPFYDAWTTTQQYVDFTMNTAGKNWINKTGITSLGLREGHDIEDTPLPIVENNYVIFTMAENGAEATTTDPKLVVEHSAGAVGPTNLTSYSGNLKANIASISGNLIANIKTLAGNS